MCHSKRRHYHSQIAVIIPSNPVTLRSGKGGVMRSGRLLTIFLCLGLGSSLAACGGGGPTAIPAGTSQVTLTIRDTPPVGVTVLAFQVPLLGATLNPTQVGVSNFKQPVSVLDSAVDVELTQLATYS